jgi:hypothetical protein
MARVHRSDPYPEAGDMSPGPNLSFIWKSSSRRIPYPEDPAFGSAPDVAFARSKCEQLWALGQDRKDGDAYTYAGDAALTGACLGREAFNRIRALQAWCKRQGIVDLSAITVRQDTGEPGQGHFGGDCADQGEWAAYLRLVLVRIWEVTPPSPRFAKFLDRQ